MSVFLTSKEFQVLIRFDIMTNVMMECLDIYTILKIARINSLTKIYMVCDISLLLNSFFPISMHFIPQKRRLFFLFPHENKPIHISMYVNLFRHFFTLFCSC